MTRLPLFVAVLSLFSCGPRAGSFSLAWEGTIDGADVKDSRTFTLTDGRQWFIEELKDQTRSAACPSDLQCYSTSALGLPAPSSDEKPAAVNVTVYNLFYVPLVGKGMTRAFITAGGSEVEGVVDIDRITLTGESTDPIEVHGTIDRQLQSVGQLDGKRRDLKLKGEFTVYPSCAGNAPTHVQFMCPRTRNDTEEAANYYGTSNISVPWFGGGLGVEPVCPSGIFSKFVDGNTARFERGSLTIGKATPLSCVDRFCTGKATVQAGDCTWDVTAIASPGPALVSNPNAKGYPTTTQVFISAVAQSGCAAEVKYCQAR